MIPYPVVIFTENDRPTILGTEGRQARLGDMGAALWELTGTSKVFAPEADTLYQPTDAVLFCLGEDYFRAWQNLSRSN